jgi:hypothetical protein
MSDWGVRLTDAIDALPGEATVAVCIAVILFSWLVIAR